MYNSNSILIKIEYLRNKMVEAALSKGFTSTESISLSQELDQLLNYYEFSQRKDKNGA